MFSVSRCWTDLAQMRIGSDVSTVKIGLLTTLDNNIGDDFIREGILQALRRVADDRVLTTVPVNKHRPESLYPSWHPIQITRLLPRRRRAANVISRLTSWAGLSVFDSCDAIIQCGAPVYWHGCHKAEWAQVFWRGIAMRLSKRMPVLNLAAGSCYPWERIPSRLDSNADVAYVRRIYDCCRVTTVRDRLAFDLLTDLGLTPDLLPCSAFLAAVPYMTLPKQEEFVFINYMPGAGHYDFGQGVGRGEWEQVMKSFVARMSKRHRLAFICHNQQESDACLRLAPDVPRFLPRNVAEYFQLAVKGKAGVFNRMHASVGFAGLGIPSLAIGVDTRMLMVNQLGLPIAYVKEATVEMMTDQLETLLAQRETWREKLLQLQCDTLNRYTAVLQSLFSSC